MLYDSCRIHGFTLSVPLRKLHGFYQKTQYFRVKQERVMGERSRSGEMVQIKIDKKNVKTSNSLKF